MVLYKVATVITGTASDASKADEGASLTTVLETPALRIELALLILLCTDAMRDELRATFDPDQTHELKSSSGTSPSLQTPVHDLINFDAPQDEASLAAQRARSRRQHEIERPEIQGLRRSALTFFDKWRAGVLNRVCEVLCLRSDVVKQAKIKRAREREIAQRSKEGTALLIDLGSDPFADVASANQSDGGSGRYGPIDNKIAGLEKEKRILILHCILLLLLSLLDYPAHSRILLLRLACSLGIELDVVAEHERSVAQGLLATAASRMDAEEAAKKQASQDSASNKWKIGLAAVGGAVLIGVTGGLAAPLLAAGVGTVMGGLGLGAISGLLGTLAGSSVLVGSLFGAYGGKMTGRLMKQYAREVDDFEFIPIQDPNRPSARDASEWSEEDEARDPTKREQHRLRVCIGVSGWLNSPSDVNKPWEVIETTGTEPFSLRFELDAMLRLGNSLNDVLFSYAWDGVTYTVVSRTLLGALYAGLWPLGLVKVASVLDNPFSVAVARADKAGKVMARALIGKVQGQRPVTLVGYSVGARVIYSCLKELAEQHAFGLVESVVLMGAPVPSDSYSWRLIRSVVTGRVVNVYSTEDYILGFLYRSTKLQIGVAGLQEVKEVHGIENFDMSKLVSGHDKYRYLVGSILVKIGFGEVNFHRVAEQERALEVAERKKEQVRAQVRRHKKDTKQPDPSSPEGPVELVVVPDNGSGNLIDVADPAPSRTASFPAMRPSAPRRSNQQPMMQRHATLPMTETLSKPSHGTEVQPNSTLPGPQYSHALPPEAERPAFAFASSAPNRQIPSNMVPTPAAVPQRTNVIAQGNSDKEDDAKIQLVDIDSQKFSPPLEEMLRITPSQPQLIEVAEGKATDVNVQQVEASADDRKDDSENDSVDDMGSEFGELTMVEPLTLEEENLRMLA